MLCLFLLLLPIPYSYSLHAQRLIWVEWRDPTHHPNLSERCPHSNPILGLFVLLPDESLCFLDHN